MINRRLLFSGINKLPVQEENKLLKYNWSLLPVGFCNTEANRSNKYLTFGYLLHMYS